MTLSLPGVALFNCAIITYGLILMYKILPETENRTLEDIEMHFADESKKITDHKIPKKSKQSQQMQRKAIESNEVSIKPTPFTIDDKSKHHAENGFTNPEFIGDHEDTKF